MIEINFLTVFDQFRYITGLLISVFLFCIYAVPKKNFFLTRVIIGYCVGLVGAMSYLPLYNYIHSNPHNGVLVSVPYWFFMSFVPVVFCNFCFEMRIGSTLLRCLIGSTVESMVTTIVRNLIVLTCFPEFPEKYTFLYVIVTVAIYVVSYYCAYRFVAKKMQKDDGELYVNVPQTTITFLCIYIFYIATIATAKLICENIILPLQQSDSFVGIFYFLRYFSVAIMVLLNLCMLIIVYYVYEVVVLQNEKRFFNQLLTEKQAQYEFSKENIELINRKCHDLKHQLKALEVANENEREEMIRETRKAMKFYDAVVKTGNEVLDTILTEKSVLCANRNIKLSCMANTNHLERIRVIDLYTMLGNAIDNAIECVDHFTNDEKKVISLSVKEQGKMIYISVENYYEGTIKFHRGYPVTQKKDKQNHGFGVKSIHMIAKRYGGDIRVSTQNQIFLLQIIIPVSK